MSQISAVSFQGDKAPKKEVVYVSKNPDRAVNATGVVAGTAGMVGGAVLGGTVGIAKLPGEAVKSLAGGDYGKAVKDTFETMKSSISSAEQLKNVKTAFNGLKNPETAEEIIKIMGSMTERLHSAFASDPAAMRVIDGVVDPLVNALSVRKNFRNYMSAFTANFQNKKSAGEVVDGVKQAKNSSLGQVILKVLGFKKPTSKIVRDVTANFAESIAQVAENVKNFTPEEKEAWGKIMKQIGAELENNPKVKVSKDVAKSLKEMFKDISWLTEPLSKLQEGLQKSLKSFDKGLGNLPIKTIGKWSAIGAAVCGTTSLLGWFGFKSLLMRKETAKTQAQQKSFEA